MKATNLTRYGFNLGARTLAYSALNHYVCNECGGAMTHRFTRDAETETTVDSVACPSCGCEDMISEHQYLGQISDGWEVEQGLPPEIRELMKGDRQCQSRIEATDDLTGWE